MGGGRAVPVTWYLDRVYIAQLGPFSDLSFDELWCGVDPNALGGIG